MTRARARAVRTERVLDYQLVAGDLLLFSKDDPARLLVTRVEDDRDEDEVRVFTGGLVQATAPSAQSVHRGMIPCPRGCVHFVREVRNNPEVSR